MTDILPDSRTRERSKGRKGAVIGMWGIYWIPIYCANCSVFYGRVPEESSFAFWLCNKCYAKHGLEAGLMAEPESVFWAKVNAEAEDVYGGELTIDQLQSIVDADSSPLASLIKQGATNLKGVL